MGTRFNVLMTIQVPLLQPSAKLRECLPSYTYDAAAQLYAAPASAQLCAAPASAQLCAAPVSKKKKKACKKTKSSAFPALDLRAVVGGTSTVGSANAARVSRGAEEDVWPGLCAKDTKRNTEEP